MYTVHYTVYHVNINKAAMYLCLIFVRQCMVVELNMWYCGHISFYNIFLGTKIFCIFSVIVIEKTTFEEFVEI